MYPPETRDKFIELRAKGYTQSAAAKTLGIHRSTALAWNRQQRHEISTARFDEMQRTHKIPRIFGGEKRLDYREAAMLRDRQKSTPSECTYNPLAPKAQ